MKLYLTARWGRREEMRVYRDELVAAGHVVTSRWLDEPDGVAQSEAAQADLDDIDAAEALIVFSECKDVGYTTGGRHVELGYAIAKGKKVVVVGPREGIFFHLPQLHFVESVEDAAKHLHEE